MKPNEVGCSFDRSTLKNEASSGTLSVDLNVREKSLATCNKTKNGEKIVDLLLLLFSSKRLHCHCNYLHGVPFFLDHCLCLHVELGAYNREVNKMRIYSKLFTLGTILEGITIIGTAIAAIVTIKSGGEYELRGYLTYIAVGHAMAMPIQVYLNWVVYSFYLELQSEHDDQQQLV